MAKKLADLTVVELHGRLKQSFEDHKNAVKAQDYEIVSECATKATLNFTEATKKDNFAIEAAKHPWTIYAPNNILLLQMFAKGKELGVNTLSVYWADEKGFTLGHLALKYSEPKKIPFLLKQGLKVNAQDYKGDTMLHYVDLLSAFDIQCLDIANADYNIQNNSVVDGSNLFGGNRTPFMYACNFRYIAKANPANTQFVSKVTENAKTIFSLGKIKIDYTKKDVSGFNTLMWALELKDENIIEEMCSHIDSFPNKSGIYSMKDNSGRNVIDWAKEYGLNKIVSIIQSHMVTTDQEDDVGAAQIGNLALNNDDDIYG